MNDMEGRKPGPTSIKVKLEQANDFKEINRPHKSETLHDVKEDAIDTSELYFSSEPLVTHCLLFFININLHLHYALTT